MSVTTIPIDDSETLFTVTFNSTTSIHTTVAVSSSVVSAWISDTLRLHSHQNQTVVVGLDCEWRPSFSRHQNPVALLQLCVSNRCLLFQLLHCDSIPQTLLTFLKDPRVTFFGVGIGGDFEKLIEDYEMEVGNKVDLRELGADKTGRREVKQMGLKGLAKEVMGVEVKKPRKVTMSRWDQEWLMLDQIGYATVDAWLSSEIGRRLLAWELNR